MGGASPSIVLWDVDGTLVDRVLGDAALVHRALKAAGVAPGLLRPEAVGRAQAEFRDHFLRWRSEAEEREGYRRVAELLLAGTGAGGDAIQRLADGLYRYFDAYAVIPGMRDILERLRRRGIRQAVLSNWTPSLRAFLDHHGLTPYFSSIVVSAEEGLLKPDPAIFRRALERLGARPDQVVYVANDPLVDVAPARRLGMAAIHFDPRRQHPTADARDPGELWEQLSALLDGTPAGR